MLNIIDAEKKYLEQYKEAYIETERQIKLGIINKRNQLFLNPDKTDVIDEYKNIEAQIKDLGGSETEKQNLMDLYNLLPVKQLACFPQI